MVRVGTLVGLLFAIAALAPAAQARMVYVRHAATAHPVVWSASDRGRHRHRLGAGTMPVISGDGTRAAWLTLGRRDAVWLAPADGRGHPRRVVRARTIGDVAFSPDGTRLGVVLAHRLAIFDTETRAEVASVRGRIEGFAFAPDSAAVVVARASSAAFDARTDLFEAALGGMTERVTSDGRSLNPVWGPDGTIVFDRARRRHDDAPVYQLWSLSPDRRQITRMKVPSLLSGLVPLELAGDHLLAEFVGQDTSLGYTVDIATGRIRAIFRRFEQGFVASDLSGDGRTVLGALGAPDPGGRHDVVTVPSAADPPPCSCATRSIRAGATDD